MLGNKQHKTKSTWLAYAGFLFQSFLKRPFGYIVAILYVVYLAIILLIVPASLHFEPLFIWNIGGFNMPIFNLYFIAAMAASMAVAIFRTGRDDGTELNLSAKPITKGTTVAVKTFVYLVIMLIISLITLGLTALIWPVFGQYDEVTNLTGIEWNKYISLMLSVFVGNTVNMLLFGGIAVFISMVGGQVIIMIGTIGLVFLMCLMNFIYPQVLRSPSEVLSDRYDTEILSYSCNTLSQYNDPSQDSQPLNFATIQCITDDDGKESDHYDTYEYWTKANKESGRQAVNYIDLGKQLSSIYSSFGLNDSKLKEASKLMVGSNSAYNYQMLSETHISSDENIENKNYPISYYGIINAEGKTYTSCIVIGSSMNLTSNNWYLITTLQQIDFNTIMYVSQTNNKMSITDLMWSTYKKPWKRLSELFMTDAQKKASRTIYLSAREKYCTVEEKDRIFDQISYEAIINDTSGAFFEQGKYFDLDDATQFAIMAKNHIYWAILAQQDQNEKIHNYWLNHGKETSFPYTSDEVLQWHKDAVDVPQDEYNYKLQNKFNLDIYEKGIYIRHLGEPEEEGPDSFTRLASAQIPYVETYSNLYQYKVTSFYNIASIIAIWSILSGVLFASSIIVYKKTDFK